eukprot:gnl/MRDRNA2_/MRDRNA2_134371_c0_seq1.p1 gnl/MRDRNA2_/MRDRNA2_134371_c0~~gnl/MRDRNA2_/MRDRNA2_134371_c0_seq1.p1  ORF type:complete len:565 (+),score=101.05 gnl/MRDRNA2_/MRDRNA2_134371_c0_seq1:53-1696(+)
MFYLFGNFEQPQHQVRVRAVLGESSAMCFTRYGDMLAIASLEYLSFVDAIHGELKEWINLEDIVPGILNATDVRFANDSARFAVVGRLVPKRFAVFGWEADVSSDACDLGWLCIWDLNEGSIHFDDCRINSRFRELLWNVVFSPLGDTVAAGGLTTIWLMNAQSGQLGTEILVEQGIDGFVFTPSGAELTIATEDQKTLKIQVVDISSGDVVFEVPLPLLPPGFRVEALSYETPWEGWQRWQECEEWERLEKWQGWERWEWWQEWQCSQRWHGWEAQERWQGWQEWEGWQGWRRWQGWTEWQEQHGEDANVALQLNPEAPEVIPAAESAVLQEVLWFSSVEHLLMKSPTSVEQVAEMDEAVSSLPARNLVLTFNRNPKGFDEALLNSELARDLVRRGVDVQPPWAKGGKVLTSSVSPDALEDLPNEIGLRTVIVHEDDEQAVWAALSGLPYDIRPRLKPSTGKVALLGPSDLSMFGDVSSNTNTCTSSSASSRIMAPSQLPEQSIEVDRTFVHFSAKGASSPRTVSTSEAHHAENPRKWVPRHEQGM